MNKSHTKWNLELGLQKLKFIQMNNEKYNSVSVKSTKTNESNYNTNVIKSKQKPISEFDIAHLKMQELRN